MDFALASDLEYRVMRLFYSNGLVFSNNNCRKLTKAKKKEILIL